jgi:hypothetical protein
MPFMPFPAKGNTTRLCVRILLVQCVSETSKRVKNRYNIRTNFRTKHILRMPSSVMLCRVALVRTDVPEERIASIIRLTRIGDIGKTLAVTRNRSMMRRNCMRYVGSYKSYRGQHPRKSHSSELRP